MQDGAETAPGRGKEVPAEPAPLAGHGAEGLAPWYRGLTRYHWLVLAVASLGWVFDVFEGQIFVASMDQAMPALLPPGTPPQHVPYYNNLTLGAFLLGGALGGVVFGTLADTLGRKRTMAYTILTYSAFTCLSAFARTWWQLAGLRFLVALGVGGEWAVASSLVAEVFPSRARAWSQSIFHASSVLGTYLAVAAGAVLIGSGVALSVSLAGRTWELAGWRLGFLLGALPALLVVWVRLSVRESDRWLRARRAGAGFGESPGVRGLLAPGLRGRLALGVALATVGMATFWGTHIYGKDVMKECY
jgi:MFS family permease